jgi:hypothetical protein
MLKLSRLNAIGGLKSLAFSNWELTMSCAGEMLMWAIEERFLRCVGRHLRGSYVGKGVGPLRSK